MKKIIIPLFFCVFALSSAAQEATNGVKLYLDVPYLADYVNPTLDVSLQNRLYSKIKMLINQTGIVEYGYSNFLVKPRLDIIDTSSSEAGMSKIYLVRCELFITIERRSYGKMGGAVFRSYSKKLTGSSLNRNEGLSAAVNSLKADDKDIIAFFSDAKTSINDYYQEHCSEVIAEAAKMEQLGQLGHAVALYFSVPSSAPSKCYQTAQDGALMVYAKYINEDCQEKLIGLKANIALALQNNSDSSAKYYNKALEIMNNLSPASADCYKEAKACIVKIETRLSDKQKQEWELLKQVLHDDASIKKQTIKAIGKMNQSYGSSPGNTVIIQNKN